MSEEEEKELKEADVIPIGAGKKEEESVEEPQGTTTKEMGMSADQRRRWWEMVFWHLTENERFIHLLEKYFIIGVKKDEDKRTVEPMIIERENVPVEISADQTFKIGVACMQHGAREATKLTQRILGILGHKDAPRILPGSDEELKKLTNQEDIKKRLDP